MSVGYVALWHCTLQTVVTLPTMTFWFCHYHVAPHSDFSQESRAVLLLALSRRVYSVSILHTSFSYPPWK